MAIKTAFKVGDKFTHLHFGYPQNVTITKEKDGELFVSNDGYNGGAWLYAEQITELNERYLNPLNWSK